MSNSRPRPANCSSSWRERARQYRARGRGRCGPGPGRIARIRSAFPVVSGALFLSQARPLGGLFFALVSQKVDAAELPQAGRLLPWRAIPGPRAGPPRPWPVARVSRPLARVCMYMQTRGRLEQLLAVVLVTANRELEQLLAVVLVTANRELEQLLAVVLVTANRELEQLLAALPGARFGAPGARPASPGPGTGVQKTGRVASCAGFSPISHAKCCSKQNWVPLSAQLWPSLPCSKNPPPCFMIAAPRHKFWFHVEPKLK